MESSTRPSTSTATFFKMFCLHDPLLLTLSFGVFPTLRNLRGRTEKKWMSESFILLTFILHIHFRSVDLLTFWRCVFQCQCLRSVWRERHWSRLLYTLLIVVVVREVVVAIDEIFTSAALQQMVKGIREWSLRFHKYRAPSQILIKELRSVLQGVVHMTLLTHLAMSLD